MEIKKTIKYDGVMKNISFVNGKLVDEDGIAIDLMGDLARVYGEKKFNISTTTKTEEIIDALDFNNGNDGSEDDGEEYDEYEE